jgi:3-hydroxyisobutyrate dehydrogenase
MYFELSPRQKIDLLVKDQSLMLAEAAAQKTPLPALSAIREVFQAARAQGLGERDISAVIRVLERAAGVERTQADPLEP